jgi:hypothetical protein
MDKLAMMYKKNQQWEEAEKLFMQVIQIRKRVQWGRLFRHTEQHGQPSVNLRRSKSYAKRAHEE